jgi:DNA-binding response OmpR family regulator
VTVRDATRDKLTGLGLGADDYITKPFDLRELEARIGAVLRRSQAAAPAAGEVVLDDEGKEVRVRGRPVALSPREYAILRLLASRPGKVFSSAEILAAAWPDRGDASVEDVKKYIHMVRRKVEIDPAHPKLVVTVRGFGYRLAGAR